MAIINGMYIHVVDEKKNRDVNTTEHPVEDGIPLTDTVQANAYSISLSGKIVDYGNMKASQVISKLESLMASGSLISYRGRNVAGTVQIKSFNSTHPNTNAGGADFDMELKQIRIAKSAYVPKTAAKKAQSTTAKKNPTAASVTVGSTVVFKGGSVYASSDAKKAAATKSRSTCKVTKISTASYAVHKYHLVSKDGKGVYGWVDFSNIEGVEATGTAGTTNAGTQQVSTGSRTAVYHTVKSGDTVYKLVTSKYKNISTSVSWVLKNNPKAFSKAGDATTLKVGAKLLIGYR